MGSIHGQRGSGAELRERAGEDHGGERKVMTGGAVESASECGDGRRASGGGLLTGGAAMSVGGRERARGRSG